MLSTEYRMPDKIRITYRTVTQQHVSHSTAWGKYPRLLKKKKSLPPHYKLLCSRYNPATTPSSTQHSCFAEQGLGFTSELRDVRSCPRSFVSRCSNGSWQRNELSRGSREAYSSSPSQPPYQLDVSGRSALRPGLSASKEGTPVRSE